MTLQNMTQNAKEMFGDITKKRKKYLVSIYSHCFHYHFSSSFIHQLDEEITAHIVRIFPLFETVVKI